MRVRVEFLSLPVLARLAGGKTVELEFAGGSVRDFLEQLAGRYGEKFRDFLFERGSGALEPSLRLLLNGTEWLDRDRLERPLADGDRLAIMMLVGGG